MAERRILYFTGDEHALYRASGAALELEEKFAADEAGLAAFRERLRRHRGALFSVLADLAGEDFHEEQIPYVRGSDREALLQRRLAQRYRDTRLAAALSLGQVSTPERRNERLLLASFTNTQQLTPWLDALEEAGTRLSGVYSVPLLAPALAAALGAREGRVLLVTANRAGLRQCYLDQGRLRFARLERTVEMAPQALALFVRSETQRLAQYLGSLRALPREGAALQVLVVAPPGQKAVFEQALVSDTRLLFRTLDQAEAERAVKLKQPAAGMQAEGLFLHLAARKPPSQQFAGREDRRRYYVWQVQRAVVAAGLAAFGVCALVAGGRWLETLQVRHAVATQRNEARTAAQQYERITATFPVTQTTTDNMKATVLEFRRIAERSASPEQAFRHVSQVLEKFPQMDLDALTWRVARAIELRDSAKPAAVPPSAPAKPAPAADLVLLVELAGRVQATQRDDYRGITEQVERFTAALTGSTFELLSRQLPFDVTSEGTLTGDLGAAGASGEAPRFTVVLFRRLP
ncbi:MAG: hypothetical protein ACT4P4_11570 [Betaproteobacteria bacterium]